MNHQTVYIIFQINETIQSDNSHPESGEKNNNEKIGTRGKIK
jgi:hypothetical protein